jgi:hypothetical protein
LHANVFKQLKSEITPDYYRNIKYNITFATQLINYEEAYLIKFNFIRSRYRISPTWC